MTVSSFDGLRKLVPAALESVSIAPISWYGYCARVIDAYSKRFKYGTKSFTTRVYKGIARLYAQESLSGFFGLLRSVRGFRTFRPGVFSYGKSPTFTLSLPTLSSGGLASLNSCVCRSHSWRSLSKSYLSAIAHAA